MADTATLEARLADAEAALHQLTTGAKAVSLSYAQGTGARSVTYTAASLDALRGYIADLKRQLGVTATRRRAIGLRF